jgi:DNA mismatch repair ATPase MutS
VIRFLLAHGAIGAVSTHDLSLADSPEFASAAQCVHFSETLAAGPNGPTMTFGYRLEPGPATSSNALRLLELLGLDDEPMHTTTPRLEAYRAQPGS